MIDTILHKWLKAPYILHVHRSERPLKPRATVIFLHGLGNSGNVWDEVLETLPRDIEVIVIDLLGFGNSKAPAWATYNTRLQAKAVVATCLKRRILGKVHIVGHSLGALVAVEIAHRYPLAVKSLTLVSPPFYKPDPAKRRLIPNSERLVKDMLRLIKKHPERMMTISTVALKLGLLNKSFTLTKNTFAIYTNALEASILNQTALEDCIKLNLPISVIYGKFDPVVIPTNLKYIAKHNPRVRINSVLAAHEITRAHIKVITKTLLVAIAK